MYLFYSHTTNLNYTTHKKKFVLQAWQRPTLPCFKAKYHWRCGVSLPSSEWDRVFHPRYNHQASNTNFLYRITKYVYVFYHDNMVLKTN